MVNIPLEDSFADIVGKSQRGLKLSDEILAARAGLEIGRLQKIKGGEVDEPALRQLAKPLGLGPDALVASARKAWFPKPQGVTFRNPDETLPNA